MPKATELEDKHTALLLMDDYGVPPEFYDEVHRQVDEIRQGGLQHFLISMSVRGWLPNPTTDRLKGFLEEHKLHPPRNHKFVRP